jgi:hypothetical protein
MPCHEQGQFQGCRSLTTVCVGGVHKPVIFHNALFPFRLLEEIRYPADLYFVFEG